MMKRAQMLLLLLAVLGLLTLSMASCGGGEEDDDLAEDDASPAESAGAKYTPSGNEGTVTGTIAFTGAVPEPISISMDADATCGAANPNAVVEDVVVKDGKLGNVFIYVKDGKTADDGKNIANLTFDVPTETKTLDQKGCHYTPHVIGVMVGQKLSVTNSDKTSHNVNVQAKSNPQFNQSQTTGAPPIEKTFVRAETLIPVKCQVHPWMKSYIGVVKHPFHAVSGEDGTYEIKGLPAGTYTLVAWHEKLGEKTQSVTVGAKESKAQDFSFGGGATTSLQPGGSFEMLPALDLPMLGGH